MSPPFDSILRSRAITFVVGPNKTQYVVHADVLTRLSRPLRALLDGDMKEAKESRVVWDDVDKHTFVRFVQWAYTDDYVTADPDILLDASNIQTGASSASSTSKTNKPDSKPYCIQDKVKDSTACPIGCNSTISTTSSYCAKCSQYFNPRYCNSCGTQIDKGCSKCCIASKGATMAKGFTTSVDWKIASSTFKPRPNKEGCEDYSAVFSCHANLYILADKYDISPLGKLSMHKLYTTLNSFNLYPSRMADILSLAELVFENTLDGDKLRLMMVHYCACIVEDLAKCDKFQPTLQAYSEFGSALMVKMSERLE
ncbi:hypothetical protein PG985_003799 [Apiospora marii]|uniref:BTB domain-containing protein n=1 Tax=Apiospora marii TaxID=335849 RepID=A0ABR1SH73_9PEZI